MTFLAPIAGLIGAAIGVPALVSLYLLKLRRKPLRVSSTLLWEQAVQDLQANVPLRWLKWSWLLALQLVALGCLLAALARPAVPGTAGIAARTIIVLDCSASMSARDGVRENAGKGGEGDARTRLDQAKTNALALIEQMRRASGTRAEGMVIAMGAAAQVVQGFTSDARALRDAVQSIRPTDQPANLDDVARIVGAAALGGAGADGETAGPRTALVVFSDGSLPPTRESVPGSVDLRLVRSGPEPAREPDGLPDNLGIVSIGVRRDADNPAIARVFVRAINASGTPIEATLSCTFDGDPAGLLPLRFPAATLNAEGISTPGEASGTLELDRPGGGLVVVSISRPDLLDADNSAAVVLRAVSKPRILVVGPNEPGDPYAQARGVYGIDRFLLGALRDLEPAEVRTIDSAAYREGSMGKSFAAFDLIVFDRVTPETMPATPTISIGANAPITGLRVEGTNAGNVGGAVGGATRFISWKRSHPILKSAPLDAVLIAPPMRMTIDEGGGAGGREGGLLLTPLAFGADGPLIALVQEQGSPAGRAVKRLVLAFDLIRTNWGKDVSFPVFVSSAVDYLTGRGESAAGRSHTTAESIVILGADGESRVRVTGADTFDLEVARGERAESAVSMGIPRVAGVYACQGAAAGFETVAVNLADAGESALATRDSIVVGGCAARLGTELAGEGPKREVWHWFVLAAAGLLTVEWFVYAWRSKP